ncbi:hypothetical protein KUTeg_019356 [Tegillarca granosa]|uniref:ATP-dependent RNA helicase n=1 Tax=Tegillarca granosa TaxID=220873 RepID=A0ABQ9ECQ9_TEGGR|nr:hypothetical protein KUTeg_019356 [Tegillarca granosa]
MILGGGDVLMAAETGSGKTGVGGNKMLENNYSGNHFIIDYSGNHYIIDYSGNRYIIDYSDYLGNHYITDYFGYHYIIDYSDYSGNHYIADYSDFLDYLGNHYIKDYLGNHYIKDSLDYLDNHYITDHTGNHYITDYTGNHYIIDYSDYLDNNYIVDYLDYSDNHYITEYSGYHYIIDYLDNHYIIDFLSIHYLTDYSDYLDNHYIIDYSDYLDNNYIVDYLDYSDNHYITEYSVFITLQTIQVIITLQTIQVIITLQTIQTIEVISTLQTIRVIITLQTIQVIITLQTIRVIITLQTIQTIQTIQAFCLPIIQIVYETLKDLQEGKGSASHWRMNVYDRGDAMAIDAAEGLLCQARDAQGWHGTRSNKCVSGRGRYYFEGTVTDEGLCRVGWSTDKATLDLGAYGMNDVVGCYLDLDSGVISWSLNGIDLGKGFDIPQHLRTERFFAAVVLKNAEMNFNFGGGPLVSKPAPNAPQAIIIETFTQIQKFKVHLSNPSIRELLIIGGVNVKDQVDALQRGIDVVVGTPGRLEDLISTGKLALSQVRFFVLDEADGLLSQGYGDLINRLHQQIPKVTNDGKRLQMIVCSATLHSFDVKKMAERLMYFPTWIDLKGQDAVPETVHHVLSFICIIDTIGMSIT